MRVYPRFIHVIIIIILFPNPHNIVTGGRRRFFIYFFFSPISGETVRRSNGRQLPRHGRSETAAEQPGRVPVQRRVRVPPADHGHGPQAERVRGPGGRATGAGVRVDRRLGRVEDVLGAPQVRVPGVAARGVAADGAAGRAGARLGAEPGQPVADQPDDQRHGRVPGVPGPAVLPEQRGQVPDAPGRARLGRVGAGRRVRAGPRGGQGPVAHHAGPGTVLRQRVERVRHDQAGAVRGRLPVLGPGRGPGRLGGRRRGPQVLALGRPAAGGRGPVRRGHRDGVHAPVVLVPAQLPHRAHAG